MLQLLRDGVFQGALPGGGEGDKADAAGGEAAIGDRESAEKAGAAGVEAEETEGGQSAEEPPEPTVSPDTSVGLGCVAAHLRNARVDRSRRRRRTARRS